MPRDNRMSRMLHVLIHMGETTERATSEEIARTLGTNPVVVRRMMAGLRDRGYVGSEKGHGGGWRLTRRLDDITLLDVYKAIRSPPLFGMGPKVDHSDCLVEQAVHARMQRTLGEAEALLMDRFGKITVGDLAKDFEKGRSTFICGGRKQTPRKPAIRRRKS